MKKRNIFILVVGIILLIIPFIINRYSIFRLISLLMGILLISLAFAMTIRHNKIIKIIIFPFVLMLAMYFLDYEVLSLFNRVPIIALREKSSSKMSAYNSLGYRVYSCSNGLTIDENYHMDYACLTSDIDTLNINKFLSNSLENYQKYQNKFVHIEGKINTIIGSSSLYLNYYEEDETTANGFVKFSEDKKLVVDNLDIDPKDFYIYDYVEVIGNVYNYVNDEDGVEIHLKDAKVIKSDIYNNYEISVINNSNKDLIEKGEKIYYLGIEEIYYKYTPDVNYELSYLLNDNREKIANLIKNIEPKIVNEEDNLYTLDEYKIIECSNKKYIILNKNITNYNNICNFEN